MITSTTNPRLKLVRGLLQHAKIRRKEKLFILEGTRLVEDMLDIDVQPEFVLYRADTSSLKPVLERLQSLNIPHFAVEPVLFNETADTQTPQGILAVSRWLEPIVPNTLSLVLITDGLANPGNLGTVLRTSAAVGVDAVLLAPGTVDPYNPKVVRGAMGAHLRVPILHMTWPDIVELGLPLYVADAGGDIQLFGHNWIAPCGIIIGGEAHGPQRTAIRAAEGTVSIPMKRGESLNASVAASVILYEIFRQRHQ